MLEAKGDKLHNFCLLHNPLKSDGYVLLTKAIRMKNGNRPLRESALHADLLARTALSLLHHVLVLHDWVRR
jgi:hypothetical protein